jgi:hypothetical protein
VSAAPERPDAELRAELCGEGDTYCCCWNCQGVGRIIAYALALEAQRDAAAQPDG